MRRRANKAAAVSRTLCLACALLLAVDTPVHADGPVLDWSLVGYLADHHVGSSNYGHFGVKVRNAGTSGGPLQVSLFITSSVARFFVARPRDLTLEPGQERIVDIRAPLYLVEEESNLHANASCSIQSNGGTASFELDARKFPVPGANVRVYQTTNGAHAWHIAPVGAQQRRMHDGYLASALFLVLLWCLARAVRIHLHGPMHESRHRRRRLNDKPAHEDGDCIDDDEQALEAVRQLEAGATGGHAGGDDAVAARARAKAQELDAWHAQTMASGSASAAGPDDEPGPAAPPPGGPATSCSVCLVRPRDAALLPCRHVCLCGLCAQRLVQAPEGAAARACPICRGPIDTWLQLYMA